METSSIEIGSLDLDEEPLLVVLAAVLTEPHRRPRYRLSPRCPQ